MKIAVTTPTGHVGSAVTDSLLEFGGDITVKLLGRRADKLKGYIDRGAETAVGVQDDANYLVEATRGVDALFWVTPPGYGADDLRAFQNRLAQAAATAIRKNNIARIVNLSSVGAQLTLGVGPISGLHDVEQILDGAAANVINLRPGFFFENLLWQMDSIRKWGRISLPISGTKSYPMIACRDIGHAAAARLVDGRWTGHSVQELHGPADLTFKDVAQTLGEVLGRKIVYIKCDRQEMRDTLLGSGMSENAADLMLEMYDAVESGTLRTTQPRSAATTTSTTLAEFAREVILPLIARPVGSTREM
jgi:uncharacterized protein YbjT (DUF2867 family)